MKKKLQLEIHRAGGKSQIHQIGLGVYPTGSETGNKILIPDSDVDRRHAILIFRKDGFWIEDLNSSIGTFVNGKRIKGRVAFSPGQEIHIGSYTMIVQTSKDDREPEKPPREPKQEESPIPPSPSPPARSYPDTIISDQDQTVREQKCQIKKQIHTELMERLDIKRLTATHIQEADLHDRVLQLLKQIIKDVSDRLPSWIDSTTLIKEIYDEAVGLGPLEDLLADPEITEIMVNRNNQVYIEKNGKLSLSDRVFMDDSSVLAIIERIVAPIGRRIDESQPYVDARLKDGSRVNAIISPLALDGPCLTIRKFSKDPFSVEDLIKFGSLNNHMAELLRTCVLLRKSIIVSGGTGS